MRHPLACILIDRVLRFGFRHCDLTYLAVVSCRFALSANKKDLKKSLEVNPDIIKIDGHLKDLKEELKQLGDR